MDRARIVQERTHPALSGMFPSLGANQIDDDERKDSNALPHRGHDLEALALQLQLGERRDEMFVLIDEHRAALPPVPRPVVREHRESGRRALYLASHASHIIGMEVPDGKMLIRELMEHMTQPHLIHTHTWEVGDLVIWDNRCTLHRGRPYDEANHKRDLRRATVEDDDPTMMVAAE